MNSRYPHKNDRVIDKDNVPAERLGTIVGTTYVRGEMYVKVKWDNHDSRYEPEEMHYEEFFTRENCGIGGWDDNLRAWVIQTPEENRLPADDPLTIAFNKSAERLNVKLLMERLGEDWNLNLIQLEIIAISHELMAKEAGPRSQYYNFYSFKAEDYRKAIDYRIREVAAA